VSRLLEIEGLEEEDSGQELRAALVLAAVSGQGFRIAGRDAGPSRRAGLRAEHLAAVRAVSMTCGARMAGAFEGSLDLRFEPGERTAGSFELTLEGGTSVVPVLQTLLVILGGVAAESQLLATGPTHLRGSPTYHFVERHWRPLIERLGLGTRLSLARAGFPSRGDGQIRASASAVAGGAPLMLEERGALLAVRGLAAAAHLGDAAERLRDAAQALLWERRRLEVEWDAPHLSADSPGLVAQLELVFERGRAAFGALGERRVRPEVAGERLARSCLRFLDGDAAVDRHVADQLLVAMVASGKGGRLSVESVTPHLLRVARMASAFGFAVEVEGGPGSPGRLRVGDV
jgi:RNA 3'-terminal phosphate cyclase (ATP)